MRQCRPRSPTASNIIAPVPRLISMRHSAERNPQAYAPIVSPREIVDSGLCVGCGVCAARMRWDKDGFLKPDGLADWLDTPSETFSHQCPSSPAAPNEDDISQERFAAAAQADSRIGRFEAAYVGYAAQDPFRPQGSSGGLTSWVAAELLRTG